jgi:hypothetical protein
MSEADLLTLYARREPAADGTPGKQDVTIYSDPAGTELKARFRWWLETCPTKRNRYVTLNCYRWRLKWI